ncbi:hypothetical protein GCM10025875_12560 [Litorihabitans aurantiacus]|uniref:Uncharacterized protein n=1 Tax=Litorihabitans aurantiacus TaxID=1930061 RepID=A0AA37UPH6_9MICO|nr:hypothetical protein GCM10025875_12560 [Litorihabitans aurantiacus]
MVPTHPGPTRPGTNESGRREASYCCSRHIDPVLPTDPEELRDDDDPDRLERHHLRPGE